MEPRLSDTNMVYTVQSSRCRLYVVQHSKNLELLHGASHARNTTTSTGASHAQNTTTGTGASHTRNTTPAQVHPTHGAQNKHRYSTRTEQTTGQVHHTKHNYGHIEHKKRHWCITRNPTQGTGLSRGTQQGAQVHHTETNKGHIICNTQNNTTRGHNVLNTYNTRDTVVSHETLQRAHLHHTEHNKRQRCTCATSNTSMININNTTQDYSNI